MEMLQAIRDRASADIDALKVGAEAIEAKIEHAFNLGALHAEAQRLDDAAAAEFNMLRDDYNAKIAAITSRLQATKAALFDNTVS